MKNWIHEPCGTLSPNSPCMIDGECSKRYPRVLVSNTVTGNDGYLLFRRSAEVGGKLATIQMQDGDTEVDNQWVVLYSPLLPKTYKAHMNGTL